MHAKYAFARALQYGWIVMTETLDTYFNVSDEGLEEPEFKPLFFGRILSTMSLRRIFNSLTVAVTNYSFSLRCLTG